MAEPVGQHTADSWRQQAACNTATLDPDAWFPEPPEPSRPLQGDWAGTTPWTALATCGGCEVRADCLADAVAAAEPPVGIWGGTTDATRQVLAMQGWQPGDPLPPIPTPTTLDELGRWVPVHTAAKVVQLHPDTIHTWARAGQVGHRPGQAQTGQPARLVDLDEIRAKLPHLRARRRTTPERQAA